MKQTRREFLRASSTLACLPVVPGWQQLAFPAHRSDNVQRSGSGRRLVVIHLDGGNDGINTVIPHGDPAYAELRPTLRVAPKRVHSLRDGLGLHSSLGDFKKLWDEDQLAIVQGVGYPQPDRSHFESTAIWETAIRDSQARAGVGWLGAALDRVKLAAGNADAPSTDSIYIGANGPPIALNGRRSRATNLTSLRDFQVADSAALRRVVTRTTGDTSTDADDPRAFLRRVAIDAYDAADRMSSVQTSGRSTRYPESGLGRHLNLAATLIGNQHPAQIYYVSHAGYDTHSDQRFTHGNLLGDLAASVRAFLADVEDLGLADSVAVMMFSEFGRTAKENGSGGTDHGTAGPVFLAGAPVRKGLVGETPSLGDLEAGEPRWSIDFRRVYAAVETQWLGLDAAGSSFEPLPLFAL